MVQDLLQGVYHLTRCLSSSPARFACGAATGAVVQTLMFPIELVKTRVMLQPSDMKLGFWKV